MRFLKTTPEYLSRLIRKMFHKSAKSYALVTEAMVLLLVTAWVTILTHQKEQEKVNTMVSVSWEQRLLQTNTMSHVLFSLNVLGGSAVLISIFHPNVIYQQLQALCRNERDTGLVVGCLLPPLVLLSRLLNEVDLESKFSSRFNFFYSWVTISFGFSVLLKIAVFKSLTSLRVNALVDVILLPMLFGLLSPIESAWRFLLAATARIITAAVLATGLKLLPRSFTIGEAILVAQGIGLCAFDLLVVTMTKLSENNLMALVLQSWRITSVDRPDYVLALEVGMLGSLLVCMALIPLLRAHGTPMPRTIAKPMSFTNTVVCVLIIAAMVGGVVYPWSCLLLQTKNPFVWLIKFLIKSNSSSMLPPRIGLMIYWAICLLVLVPLIRTISNYLKLRNIVARKLFHVLIAVMLGPASIIDVPMLSLSYGVAISVFLIVECARALSLPPFGRSIAVFMRSFIDYRESGRVILTHSYLLLGCALPLWLAPSFDSPSILIINAGIVALGIGDAMGALVGSSVGSCRIFGNKTVEGSTAVFTSMFFASVLLQNYRLRVLLEADYMQVILLTVAVLLTTFLEAATAQIDNLVLPLFFYVVCNLVECHRLL
ncbi:putative polyprenol kinase family [Plasmopara halstedii]